MFGIGTTEIILIVAILILLFGATLLPKLAKGLGQSRRALREGLSGENGESTRENDTGALVDKHSEPK